MDAEWNVCPSCGTPKQQPETVINVVNSTPQNASSGTAAVSDVNNDGLLIAAYIFAIISTLFLPICCGPIALILSSAALIRGDKRGGLAMIVSFFLMLIGMFVGALVWELNGWS